jgi:hypothetical protein
MPATVGDASRALCAEPNSDGRSTWLRLWAGARLWSAATRFPTGCSPAAERVCWRSWPREVVESLTARFRRARDQHRASGLRGAEEVFVGLLTWMPRNCRKIVDG